MFIDNRIPNNRYILAAQSDGQGESPTARLLLAYTPRRARGIMILLYAVGGVPSEGETPMETVSSCPSVVVT